LSYRKLLAASAILTGTGFMTDVIPAHAFFTLQPQTTLQDFNFEAADSQNPPPLILVYKIREGDTLSHISKVYRVSVDTLMEVNGIKDPTKLQIGQKIRVPLKTKRVELGSLETKPTEEETIGLNPEFPKDGMMAEPVYLRLDDGIPLTSEVSNLNQHVWQRFPKVGQGVSNKHKSVRVASFQETRTIIEKVVAQDPIAEVPTIASPVQDVEITSKFGMRWGRHHNGVDMISRSGKLEIRAGKTGVVVASHYDRGGLGNVVVVDHGNGVETIYGHLKKRKVKEGEVVRAGEVIGIMGNTGSSTGTHLHFEVRKNDQPLNPLRYLSE
jgi:murein DD-endopeptidase MepM/ murein hydrolase activator NlpD